MGENEKAEGILKEVVNRRGDSESKVNMMVHLMNSKVPEAVRQG